MPPKKITAENAREMQQRSAESRRRNREEAQAEAEKAWKASLSAALDKHVALMGGENESVALGAVRELYDRLLGRPTEKAEVEHSGAVSINVRSAFDDDRGGSPVPGDDEAEPTVEGVA